MHCNKPVSFSIKSGASSFLTDGPPLQLLPARDMLVLLKLVLGEVEIRSELKTLSIMGVALLATTHCVVLHPALDAPLRTGRSRYE